MTHIRAHSVFGWLSNRLLDVSGVLLLIMMLHVTLDVGMKYFFNRPVPGTLEIVSYYYMVGAVFFPIAFVELTRSSVAVDLFYSMMPRRMKIACMVLVLLGCAAVYGGLGWISYGDALRSFSRSEVVMGPVTVLVWPSRFVLPVSFALGGLVCLWHLYRLATNPAIRDEIIGVHPETGDV